MVNNRVGAIGGLRQDIEHYYVLTGIIIFMFATKKPELYWVLGIHEFTEGWSDDDAEDEAKTTSEREGIKPDGSSSNGGVRSMGEEQDDEETLGK